MNLNNSNKNNTYKTLFFICAFIIAGILGGILIKSLIPKKQPSKPLTSIEYDEPTISNPIKDEINIKFVNYIISGDNLQTLRENLLKRSEELLKNKINTPTNVRFIKSKNIISFDLKDEPSDFIKLSLVFGPKNIGCESCLSVLKKNPGSKVLLSTSNSDYYIEIIAIHN